MVQETWVQSQVESYQRLLKWYLIPPCLTLSNIRYVSRVKWSNPGKGVAPSHTPRCSSNWKGSLRVALDCGRQLYFYVLISEFIVSMKLFICLVHIYPTPPPRAKIRLKINILEELVWIQNFQCSRTQFVLLFPLSWEKKINLCLCQTHLCEVKHEKSWPGFDLGSDHFNVISSSKWTL